MGLIPYFAAYYTLLMKAILSERNIVVVLFVMVLVTFSLAQEDSKKMEKINSGVSTTTASTLLAQQIKASETGKTTVAADGVFK